MSVVGGTRSLTSSPDVMALVSSISCLRAVAVMAAAASLLVGDAHAQGASAPRQEQPATCRLPTPIPAGVKIFAAGDYRGLLESTTIDPDHATGTFDVRVHEPEAPVVLMLGSYEAAIWRVRWTPPTKIVGVYVAGHGRQIVDGLPPTVPTLIASHWATKPVSSSAPKSAPGSPRDGPSNCPVFYVVTSELTKLNPIARAVFGQPVTRVFFAQRGVVKIGDPEPALQFISNPAPVHRPAGIAYGDAGLAEAVRLGAIRPATWTDIDSLQLPKAGVPSIAIVQHANRTPVGRSGTGPYRTFIVLKAFAIPPGLYGGESVDFIVLPGVPRPTGDPGHSKVIEARAAPTSSGGMR